MERQKKPPMPKDGLKNFIFWLIGYNLKEIYLLLLIILIGLFIIFNVNYNKKDGLVIKPSMKVELK